MHASRGTIPHIVVFYAWRASTLEIMGLYSSGQFYGCVTLEAVMVCEEISMRYYRKESWISHKKKKSK